MTKQLKHAIGNIMALMVRELSPAHWADINQLRQAVREENIIDRNDPAVIDELLSFAEGELIRRAMRRKDGDAFPLFPSIRVRLADGTVIRKYICERKMKPIHYAQYRGECHQKVLYWMNMENATCSRCNDRWGTQLELPWPEVAAASKAIPA